MFLLLLKRGRKGICLYPGCLKVRTEVSFGLDVVVAAGELGRGREGRWQLGSERGEPGEVSQKTVMTPLLLQGIPLPALTGRLPSPHRR